MRTTTYLRTYPEYCRVHCPFSISPQVPMKLSTCASAWSAPSCASARYPYYMFLPAVVVLLQHGAPERPKQSFASHCTIWQLAAASDTIQQINHCTPFCWILPPHPACGNKHKGGVNLCPHAVWKLHAATFYAAPKPKGISAQKASQRVITFRSPLFCCTCARIDLGLDKELLEIHTIGGDRTM